MTLSLSFLCAFHFQLEKAPGKMPGWVYEYVQNNEKMRLYTVVQAIQEKVLSYLRSFRLVENVNKIFTGFYQINVYCFNLI